MRSSRGRYGRNESAYLFILLIPSSLSSFDYTNKMTRGRASAVTCGDRKVIGRSDTDIGETFIWKGADFPASAALVAAGRHMSFFSPERAHSTANPKKAPGANWMLYIA
jgi:hypothetical protein